MEYFETFCYAERGVAAIIIKFRKRPAKIDGYEALLKRLPIYHPKQETVEDLLKSSKAGFGGEQRLDELMKHFDPDYEYLIIQDLSISKDAELQVDTVLLTRSCIILLEVKNISGRLKFSVNPSALHQTTQNGKERGYKSPLVQMEVIKWKFEKVLKSLKYSLPIHTFVVIAYPNQIVENTPPGSIIWSADEVMIRLQNFRMPPERVTSDELLRLGQQLVALSAEYSPFPLAPKINIHLDELEKGVFCPKCKFTKMLKIHRTWKCHECEMTDSEAHHEAIREWFMIIKPTISVAECKDFLGLEYASTARNFLTHPRYKKAGSNKTRRYYIEEKADIHEK